MATSSTVTFYTGYYAGGKPTVLSANPFDVAQDLSTGNLWQYTGAAWVAPSWQTSITIWLGAAESVCQRLHSEDTRIPDTVHVYSGTEGAVPPELALTADDLAIKHDVGNYNLNVNVLRKDVTTDTFVDVPFPEGYVVTTEDGNWTVLKNFNKCVGYDYATVSLAWTTTADGQGPQSVNYVTSSGAQTIASSVVSGALVDYPTSSEVEQMVSGATISGALISGNPFATTVAAGTLTLSGAADDEGGLFSYAGDFQGVRAGVEIKVGEWDADPHGTATLYADDDIILSAGSSLTLSGGTLTLRNTYFASDEETVVSNTFSMTDGSIDMGCNDPDLGSWGVYFNTQNITLSVNNTVIYLDFEYVSINKPLYVSSSLVLLSDPSNATIEVDSSGDVTLNSENIATQPWVNSQLSSAVTSAQAAAIVSSAIAQIPPTTPTEILDWESTSATIPMLSGGVVYNFLRPVSALSITNIEQGTAEGAVLCRFSGGANFSYPTYAATAGATTALVDGAAYRFVGNMAQLIGAEMNYQFTSTAGGAWLIEPGGGSSGWWLSAPIVSSGCSMFVRNGGAVVEPIVVGASKAGTTALQVYPGAKVRNLTVSGSPAAPGVRVYGDVYGYYQNVGFNKTYCGGTIRSAAIASGEIHLNSAQDLSASASLLNCTMVKGTVYNYNGGYLSGLNMYGGRLILSSGCTALGVMSAGGSVSSAAGAYVEYVDPPTPEYGVRGVFVTPEDPGATIYSAMYLSGVSYFPGEVTQIDVFSGGVILSAYIDVDTTVHSGGLIWHISGGDYGTIVVESGGTALAVSRTILADTGGLILD